MTLTVPTSRPVTIALLAALTDAGLTAAEGTGKGLTAPYSVLYPSSPDLDGPLGDRYADAEHTVMVHHVGAGPEQAEFQSDQVAAAWLPGLTVTGRSVLYVDRTDSQPVQRDDDTSPPLYYVVDTYVVATTTA
jgi:hypothetical protein